jgi:YegS/Rv2252/BmrU family lipid kinase
MSESKKVFFIINKFSGGLYHARLEGRIIDECRTLGYDASLQFTKHRGHATELAQQAVAERYNQVFAVGGDGTVNEVARGLVHTGIPMGIIPKGSGNGLARHLGLPMSIPQAVAVMKALQQVNIDTFLVNGHLGVNVAGVGFDGHVAGMFGTKSKRGLWGYAQLVLREYVRFSEFGVTLIYNGTTENDTAFTVAFANSSQFGNNAKIAPRASVCDGYLEVCRARKIPLPSLPAFLWRLFNGQLHTSQFVHSRQLRDLQVRLPVATPYHVDGEPFAPEQQFHIQVQPASLAVLVPHAHRKL